MAPSSDPSRPSALLFPGQGSQTAGMAALVAAERPALLELAARELGGDPFDGVAESTARAQPAIYLASLAHWERAGRPRAEMAAGHSLGELAALVVAGALDEESGLRLALLRGRLMEEAGRADPGGMLAVLGDAPDLPAQAEQLGLTVANDNAPGQVVLSGPAARLGDARRELRAAGLKAIRLPVAGAFHSPAMAPAAEELRRALAATEFRAPSLRVYSSITTEPFDDPRADLAAALTRPVRWRQTLERMHRDGAAEFIEVGPGDVLTGLVRRSLDGVTARSLAGAEAVGS